MPELIWQLSVLWTLRMTSSGWGTELAEVELNRIFCRRRSETGRWRKGSQAGQQEASQYWRWAVRMINTLRLSPHHSHFQDSSKVNYSTIKVHNYSNRSIWYRGTFWYSCRLRQPSSTTLSASSPKPCTSWTSHRTSTSAPSAATASTPGNTATASSTSWSW